MRPCNHTRAKAAIKTGIVGKRIGAMLYELRF